MITAWGGMMLTRIEGPQDRVISRELLKQHLRVTTAADDVRIDALLLAAEAYLDGASGILGRALRPQSWQWTAPDWPAGGVLQLPLPPTIAVVAVEYLDAANVLQTLAVANYRQISGGDAGGDIVLFDQTTTMPTVYPDQPDAVRVTFTCGYEDLLSPANTGIPEAIVFAIVLMVRCWYDAENTEIPDVVRNLVAPYRVARASIGSD